LETGTPEEGHVTTVTLVGTTKLKLENMKIEHAIYYLSKKFTDCEKRYSMVERTCCALAWAAHRLRQYMLSHTTWLISKMDPIKYIFEKPTLFGRIARWQMLLIFYMSLKNPSRVAFWLSI